MSRTLALRLAHAAPRTSPARSARCTPLLRDGPYPRPCCPRSRRAASELHTSTSTASSSALTSFHLSKQQVDATLESACYNSMFQMFQGYVASVVYRCCKSRSGCCTCCNCYTCMFQVCSPNVSSVLDECCIYFYLVVAKVDLDVFIYMHVASIF
jgi:hypothetical protein